MAETDPAAPVAVVSEVVPSAVSVLIDGVKAAAQTAFEAASTNGASDGSAKAWETFSDELAKLLQAYTPDVIDPVVPEATNLLVQGMHILFSKVGGEVPAGWKDYIVKFGL